MRRVTDPAASSSTPSSSPRATRPILAALIAQIAFGLGAMTISLPSMQDWRVQLGVPQATVQLTLSAYVLAFGLLQLVWGPLSDHWGRRPVLLAGWALMVVGLIAAALAPNASVLVAARFLQGVGAAAGVVAARAAVQDLFEGAARARALGYSGMALGLTPPFATVVGGQIHVAFGWRANFALLALLGAALLAFAWHVLPRPASRPTADDGHGRASAPWWRTAARGYAHLLRVPTYLPWTLTIALTAAAWYAFLAAAPLVLGSYGVGPARLGIFVMTVPLSYIVGSFLTTRLASRWSGSRLMFAGQGLSLAGIVLMMLLAVAGIHSPWAFALPLALMGVGHGLLLHTATARTIGIVAGLAGAASAVMGVMQQGVGAASGFVVGLVPHDGPMNLGWAMLIPTLLSLAMLWVADRRPAPVADAEPMRR